jgi:hypothetical protein
MPANERDVVVRSVVMRPNVEMAPPTMTTEAMEKPPTASPTFTQNPSPHAEKGTFFSFSALHPTNTGGM